MTTRSVIVTDDFFDDLNGLLPAERTADGGFSRTDFLAYVMPSIIDTLSTDYETSTTPWRPDADSRIRITPTLIGVVTVYTELVDEVVNVIGLEIGPA